MSNTVMSSVEIALLLKRTDLKISINTYWNPFGGKVKIMNSCKFEVNTNKISCVTAYAVNTLINQTICVVARMGNQNLLLNSKFAEEEEENAFPGRIGEIAEIISRKTKQFA